MEKVLSIDEDARNALICAFNGRTTWKPLEYITDVKVGELGIGLYARYFIPAGFTVLRDEPIFFSAAKTVTFRELKALRSCIKSDCSFVTEESLLPLIDYISPLLDASTRRSIQSLFCPSFKEVHPDLLKGYISSLTAFQPKFHVNFDENELLRFLLICNANAFQVQGYDGMNLGQSLYMKACRVNHSCKPNTWWYVCPKTRHISFRALRDISPGQEITQSYLDEERWGSTLSRRLALNRSKWFHCSCSLCSSYFDFARGFSCPNCFDGNVYLANDFQEHSKIKILKNRSRPVINACDLCAKIPPISFALLALQLETVLEKEVKNFSDKFGTSECTNIASSIMKLLYEFQTNMLSDRSSTQYVCKAKNHYLVAQFYYIYHDLAKIDCLFAEAAGYIKKSIEIMESIYSLPSNRVGWMYEHMGDDLTISAGIPMENVLDSDYVKALKLRASFMQQNLALRKETISLVPAFEAYEKALNRLKFLYGENSDNPAISSLTEKIQGLCIISHR